MTEPHGDQPFGSYQVSDIDQIGFANGSLDVRIPLFARSGRGLTHQKVWSYTSKTWFEDSQPPCDPTVLECPPPPPPFWNYVDYQFVLSSSRRYIENCGNGQQQEEDADYTYVDPEGTPHVFDVVTSPVNPPQTQCVHVQLMGHALDGSGMALDLSDSTNPIITLKDGTKIVTPTSMPGFVTLRRDANGNMITVSTDSTGNVNGEFDTLGRNIQYATGTLPDGAKYEDWIPLDSNGNPQRSRIESVNLPVCTNFQQGDTLEYCPGTMPLARKIDLPNGLAYQFTYDIGTTPGHYGELLRIDLPSGGYIRYEYGPMNPNLNQFRAVTKRTVSEDGTSAGEKVWTYEYQYLVPDTNHNTTIVTDPDGNQTAHVTVNAFLNVANPQPVEVEARYYQGTAASGRLLKTVRTDYEGISIGVGDGDISQVNKTMVRPIRVTTLLDNGLVSKVETDYDPLPDNNGVISYSRANVHERREYDYGQGVPGPLLRRTDYTYLHNANAAYANANIVDRVLNTTVYDGAGNVVAQTQNGYDGSGLANTNSSGSCSSPIGAPNHDYCNFSSANLLRGNLTSVARWRNTDNSWLTTTYTYDDLGNILSVKDPGSHPTTYSFSDSWSGGSCVPSGMNTYAFVTQVTNALNQRSQASYYSCSGLIQSRRDENDIDAGRNGETFTYDSINRLLTAIDAEGGSTSFDYHTVNGVDTLPLTITSTKVATPDPSITSSTVYDGLGRVKTTSLDSDPEGADIVDTTYDNLGRKLTVSNPHRATANATDGISTTYYDALGRVVQVAPPDGTLVPAGADVTQCLANNVCTSYSGNSVTTTDQAGKQRRSFTDPLGRLVEVDEPGDNYAGVASSGSITISGTLRSVGTATVANGSVTVSGTETQYMDTNNCTFDANGFETCPMVWDEGTVSVTVNGLQKTYGFGQGDSTDTIAAGLASQFNSDATSPVTASSSGGVLSLVSKASGAASNYPLSASYGSANGSFTATASGTTLTGGTDAGDIVYDSGTVNISVGGFTASAPYSQTVNYTAGLVASALVGTGPTGLNRSGSPVSAKADGTTITLNYTTPGIAGNVAVSVTSSPDDATQFPGGSFCSPACTSALMNGVNPEGPSLDHNFYVTQYSYDALDNLLTVTQKGDPSINTSAQWRVRNFTYDSLSRLLSASNPESNTAIDQNGNPVRVLTTYSYDPDGNLLQKTSPAPNQTGTATQTVSYCYDALHRVTGKAYSAQSCPLTTPVVTYSYDVGAEGVGRMTSLSDQAGSGSYTYDVMGRIASEQRTIAGVSKTMSYGYDQASALTSVTYPSTAVMTYTPDAAGRTISAIDNRNGINYAQSATFAPDGSLAGFVSGNSSTFAGVTNSFSYNQRLQPVNMNAVLPSGTKAFSLTYDFHLGAGNNGDVWGITNNRDSTRSQTFTYDALNRLISAQNAGTDCTATTVNNKTKYWGNSYGYDPWGNLTAKIVSKCSAEHLTLTALVNNQLSGYGYDAAGNMTWDPTDGVSASYDSENHIAGATKGGVTTGYVYDADGNRVEKVTPPPPATPTTGTLYWYMTPGIVAESDLAGNLKSEYVFFNGERVARRDFDASTGAATGVFYYFSDHLKTASVITDSAGNVKAESDYYPWGGELQFINNDSNHYKFTGKERDSESGLDYFGARYYSNGLGRFITPDWAAKATAVPYAEFSDPQSLNLYSYVRNIPTVKADGDGHCAEDACILEVAVVAGLNELTQAVAGVSLGVALGSLTNVPTPTYTEGQQVTLPSGEVVTAQSLPAPTSRADKSTEQLRKEWEKLTGQKWPIDPNTGKNQDAHHTQPKADGGVDAGTNVEPMPHDRHVDHHKKNGDFKRWGKRAHQKPPEPQNPKPPKREPPKPEPSPELKPDPPR